MDQVENADLLKKVLRSIVDIIRRRSSEDYAVVMINNIIKKLTVQYPFLKNVAIQNVRYSELAELITVPSDINSLSSQQLQAPIKDLLGEIVSSTGKTAGYFFIKELKDAIESPYDVVLDTIGIDLSILQYEQIMEKRPVPLEPPTMANVLTRIFDTLLRAVEETTGSREFAFSIVTGCLKGLVSRYAFLEYIAIKDPHYLQTEEMALINEEINAVDPLQVGAVLQEILKDVNKAVEKKEIFSLLDHFKNHLIADDLQALYTMGVHFEAIQISHEAVFRHVMKALIVVLGKTCTTQYAVFALDSILKKLDAKYDFLNYVKIDSSRYSEGCEAVSIMTSIDTLKPLDAGKGIQKLIEEVVNTIGDEVGQHFIQEFKGNLEKVYLTRMEEMGVNFHIIQLRQDLLHSSDNL